MTGGSSQDSTVWDVADRGTFCKVEGGDSATRLSPSPPPPHTVKHHALTDLMIPVMRSLKWSKTRTPPTMSSTPRQDDNPKKKKRKEKKNAAPHEYFHNFFFIISTVQTVCYSHKNSHVTSTCAYVHPQHVTAMRTCVTTSYIYLHTRTPATYTYVRSDC